MQTTSEFINYYEVLEVSRKATDAEITEALRKERRKWRQRQNAPDPDRRTQAESRMRQIDAAEKTLLDPAARQAHNREIDTPRADTPSAPAAAGAGEWVDRANAYLNVSNPRMAHHAAVEACRHNPSDPRAWYIRGQASSLLGDLSGAEFELTESLRLDPGNVGTHIDLSAVMARAGDVPGAFAVLENAWRIEPGNAEVRVAMVDCYIQNGSAVEAVALAEPLVTADPSDDYYRYLLAFALSRAAQASCTTMRDDTYYLTTPAQITAVLRYFDRAWALNVPDEGLKAELVSTRNLALASREKVYVTSDTGLWAIGFLVSVFAICFYGLGVVMLAGMGWWYYETHWIAQWKINDRLCRSRSWDVLSWGVQA